MPASLQLTNLRVRSLSTSQMMLTWEVADTTEDALDYTFQVLRSEAGKGPFERIGSPFEDKYLFIDTALPGPDKNRTLFYRIDVTNKASGNVETFGPCALLAEPSLDAQAMRLNEQVLFSQAIGRRCWVFPVRTFGARCPTCWDKTLQSTVSSRCLQCYGTSFLRGYHNPIASWVQIDPSPRDDQTQSLNRDSQDITTARMSFFPPLKPDDIIVEYENRRWRVVKVTTTERLRAVIHQELVLREIAPTDIEYDVPVDINGALELQQPSPARMFSNPTNIQSAILERTPNVFALYETDPKEVEE